MKRLAVCAMLISAALATSAQAATNERFSLEITYTRVLGVAEQVCAALHNAGFAQCPSGGANFRSGHVAKGGPAKPGTSRHELGAAADITVRFPPRGLKDLAKYQAAAHKAGLCGPPKGDDVHVELPYAAKKGKPILCHFPPGPAP